MSYRPLKPWKSHADKLALLIERGMGVEDRCAALNYLQRVGYYRLSAYWYPLRAIDPEQSARCGRAVRHDHFVSGSRFEDVVRLYVFDKKLRLLAIDALERIEMAVRVDVAHLLGQKDALAHEHPECLHGGFSKKIQKTGAGKGQTAHQSWLLKYRSLLQRARNEPFVQHHLSVYGTLPVWAATEVWDFGLLSKLFAGMRHADQQEVSKKYGVDDGRTFASWLRSLNFIRNVAAHHGRLWNLNVLERSPVPKYWPAPLDNARPFFYFCLMRQLLAVICPNSLWHQRLADLLFREFPVSASGHLSLSDLGVFPEWQSLAPWRK